jgi:hypothetical protein
MNIVSVSWSDHLSFGQGDGRLDTPDALARRMQAWKTDLNAGALHWRMLRPRIPGRFFAANGYQHPSEAAASRITWDDFAVVPTLARDATIEPWLYVSVFDEGFPLAPRRERAVSHHNPMHGQHVAWQSELTRQHPEWLMVDRSGRTRQAGVICLAYPEARAALVERWTRLLEATAFAGLFLCLRSQSRPAEHADQFGFNEPVRREFQARHDRDILREDFEVQAWRDLLGEYITALLCETGDALRTSGVQLGVGVPRGDVLGPPLGNATVAWREWLSRGLIDVLVIGQNSSQCPSMWHQLWPMHRGYGYVQDYLQGRNLPAIGEYARAAEQTATRLFIARQWRERSDAEERALLETQGVSGLVFGSFRHDNPAAIARGDWTAGRRLPSDRAPRSSRRAAGSRRG